MWDAKRRCVSPHDQRSCDWRFLVLGVFERIVALLSTKTFSFNKNFGGTSRTCRPCQCQRKESDQEVTHIHTLHFAPRALRVTPTNASLLSTRAARHTHTHTRFTSLHARCAPHTHTHTHTHTHSLSPLRCASHRNLDYGG